MQEYFYLYGYSLFRYDIFEICKNASFIKYHSGLFLHIFKLCLATIEVCVFCAAASVAALFNLWGLERSVNSSKSAKKIKCKEMLIVFEDIGAKIKAVTKVFCWVSIIVSVIAAFVMFYMAGESYSTEGFYNGMGWVFLIVLPLGSWLTSLFVYGFGELIERTTEIAESTKEQTKTSQNKMDGLYKVGLVTQEEYAEWIVKETLISLEAQYRNNEITQEEYNVKRTEIINRLKNQ